MARVLITGATGFIGSHLARACLARGDEVSVIARPASSLARLADVSGRIAVHRLDLAEADRLRTCLAQARPEIIFHAGARTRYPAQKDLTDLSDSVTENLSGLIALLSAAAFADVPPRVFVRTGSIAEYGDIETPYVETAREAPRNAYGASILAGTQYMAMARPRLPFQAVTARLALTYGPEQSSDFLIPKLIEDFFDEKPVTIHRPHDRRDLIHVDDVIRALLLIADDPVSAGAVINVGTGDAPKMAEVARILVTMTGARRELASFGAPADPPVVLNCDPGKVKATLGWTPQILLPEGLERTVQWARQSRTPHSQPVAMGQGA